MDLLYRAGGSNAYEFWSWVPKWTGRELFRTILTWRSAEGTFFAGSNSQVPVHPPLSKADKVTGFEIDTIVELCLATTNEPDIISMVNIIHASID
jgi:hypothetical protein